jgi:hypothetical protein
MVARRSEKWLYALGSDGMHSTRTDDEAIEVIDEVDQALCYPFVELKAHRQKRKEFTD